MKTKKLFYFLCFTFACKPSVNTDSNRFIVYDNNATYLFVLGTIQDGGSPHMGCNKACCKKLFIKKEESRKVISLGIIDFKNSKNYIFEATPDFVMQMKSLARNSSFSKKDTPDGIFLTHAHIGHYTGLMYLGKEAMNSTQANVFAMPRMKLYLENNGPWSQLVGLKNISIQALEDNKKEVLTSNVSVTPILVPHRDEFSETVGFVIQGPNKKVLFIPDIDKWEKWEIDINKLVQSVDYAFLDGTFYDGEELNNRNIAEIPHPFIIESMKRFESLSAKDKSKIYFTHFNHTNPLLDSNSKQYKTVLKNGFNISRINQSFKL